LLCSMYRDDVDDPFCSHLPPPSIHPINVLNTSSACVERVWDEARQRQSCTVVCAETCSRHVKPNFTHAAHIVEVDRCY
jgi:hypothetical protein